MHRLSNLDASFLHLGSARSPMHIGCTLTFSQPKNKTMTFEQFKSHIQSHLSISPVFRKKLATQILDLDRPAWLDDESFDIDQHLFHTSLKGELHEHDKKQVINQFFSRALNHHRPLWEIMYMESENKPDEFFVLLKFHHAAVDGMSAEHILAGLLSPKSAPQAELTDDWKPEHQDLPSTVYEIGSKHIQNAYRSPLKVYGLAKRLSHSIFSSQALRMLDKEQRPPHFFTAPETPFNQAISKKHFFASAHLPLYKVKEIRKAYPGSTINDVVLAICSGALRKNLETSNELPEESLVAMIPVSKREKDEQGSPKSSGGNLISPMLISLATDLDSPSSRLGMIHQNALRAKEFNYKVAVERIMKHLPSWSSSLTMKAYTRLRLANILKPVFNLIITNVPGPKVPLFLNGAELKSLEGVAPIVDNMALTAVVTSYVDTLTISLTSCESIADKVSFLASNFNEALDELYQELVPERPEAPSPQQAA